MTDIEGYRQSIRMRYLRGFLYKLIQLTWGFPQTLAGFIIFLINLKRKHERFHGSVLTLWDSYSSLSLGMFVFISDKYVNKDIKRDVIIHEYGHTVQSLILGPLYLPIIGIPSFLWANLPSAVRKRREHGLSYYSFLPERNANRLGCGALHTNQPTLEN